MRKARTVSAKKQPNMLLILREGYRPLKIRVEQNKKKVSEAAHIESQGEDR